ncbi:uncharacterized protein LOC144445077 [Glandiceps talaboti]
MSDQLDDTCDDTTAATQQEERQSDDDEGEQEEQLQPEEKLETTRKYTKDVKKKISHDQTEINRHRQYQKQLDKMKAKNKELKNDVKVAKPQRVPYTPYTWNSLGPYCTTDYVQTFMNLPNKVRHGYITKKTAISMVDPEVAYRMNVELDPIPESRPKTSSRKSRSRSKKLP